MADPIITISDASVLESNSSSGPVMNFTVTLSEAAATDVLIKFQTSAATATQGVDYQERSGTLTIAAGLTSGVIAVNTYGDSVAEADEFFVLQLSDPQGASFANGVTTLRAAGTILDNDGTGDKLAVFVDDVRIVEGDAGLQDAVFQVRLSRDPGVPVTLDFTTVDGSALAGTDYIATAGTLTFTPGGALVQEVTVPVLGDTVVEPSDLFSLAFTVPSTIVQASLGEATILDDDAGTPTVSVSGASATEGSTGADPFYLNFAVTLSAAATSEVTVQYRLLSGTAQEGDDAYFPTSARSVTFAAGETSKTVSVRVTGDFVAEPDEAVVLEVFSASGGAALAGDATTLRATGWILDDDGSGNTLALFTSRPVVVEGDSGSKQANFEVSLSRPAPEAFSVSYTTVDGSALAGEDYTATSGTLSFVEGQTSASVTVPVLGDTVVEPSDLFSLAFTVPSTIVQASLGEATILDDDAGTPTVSVSGASTTEGTTSSDPFYLNFAVTLSAAATSEVTVQYRLLSGTAQEGDDAYFPSSARSVTFAAGETSKTISVRVNADSVAEPDEAVVLEVFSASGGAALAGDATTLRATGWILDDDGSGNKLALFTSRPVVVEGDSGVKQANFEVSLSRPAPEAFSVSYTTVDGSALAGEDYTATSGTLSFVVGQTSASVTVPVLGDTVVEPSELFTLAFTVPSTIVQTSLGEATILDDDAGTPTVSVSGASTTEGTTSSDPFYLNFAVTLSAAATSEVTVQYRLLSGTAQEGDDAYFPSSARSVTFAAGETSKTISVRVSGDFVAEPDEAVVLEVFSASGGAALAGDATTLRATGWILDDDGSGNKLALFTSRPVVVEGDSGVKQANFEVSLSRPAPEAFSVSYTTVDGSALAGEDYTATSGTLSFVEGQTSASVTVPVLGDTVVEPSDLFSLAFTVPSTIVQASLGEATILDDDAGTPTVSVSGASTTEGTTSSDPFYLNFAVTLSAAATSEVTVQYRLLSGTAQAGDDAYFPTSARSVTFAAGETSKTVSVRVNADSVAEPDEAVVLEVFSASGGAVLAGDATTLRATGWILDDDGSGNKLALFTSRPVVVEGDSGVKQANFEVSLSRPAPEAFSVSYTTVDGSALAGEDYTATSGTLSFVEGQTSASVTVPVLGDTVVEPSDLFSLAFTVPSTIVQASLGEATILDDDAGTPTVSVSGASTTEGTTSSDPFYLNFAVTLSAAATSEVTVQYRLLSGTAQEGDDAYFPSSARSVTFAAGETSKTVSVRVNADSVAEPDEAVVLEVFSASGGAALAGDATTLRATGWILDDDGSGNKLALFTSRPVVVEGDSGSKQANFEVSLSRPAPEAFSVSYTTVDGSALAGEDYTATSGTLSFVVGQTSASVTVPVLGDTVVEPSELFTLAFTVPSTIVQTSLGEATILDDDAGTPTVSVSGASTTEGTTSSDPFYLNFAVTLSAAATSEVTVQYRLLSGSGLAEVDAYFPSSARSVTFAAGETSKTVSVRVTGDSVAEPDEAVVLEVFSASGGAALAGNATAVRATGWIIDDDGTGNKLGLYSSQPVLVEGDAGSKLAYFELSLSRPAPEAFSVSYATVDGTAVAGEDYVASSGTISFAAGQLSSAVLVPVLGDPDIEPSELFTLALSAPDTVVQTTLGQATILDDDAGLPTVSVGGATALEGSTSSDPYYLSFEVRLSAPATSDVTVDYRLLSGTGEADVDAYFPSSARSVTFIAGEVSKIVNVRVNADTEVEPDERVILELTNVDGGVFAGGLDLLQATGLILDDDGSGNKLGLFVENARIVEGADGVTRQVAVPIVLSRPVDTELTFSFSTASGSAVAGADYIETAGTVTFLPGQTLAAAFVPIIGDGLSEPSETFTLTVTPTAEIANGSDGATGTVTIVDGNVAGPVDGVSVNAGPDAVLDEGATLSRTIIFGDEVDRGGDGWSYEVDWDGDGTADESGVLAAGSSSFNISRLFPDGPASRTVTVKVIDQAGVDEASASFDVTVNDVAPIIALGGAAEIEAGATYTLDLGAISDPGTDSVTEYLVSWGDGATTSVASGGPVTHAYASAGPRTITVALRDEDGLHTSAGSLSLAVLAANTPPVGANDTYSVHSGDTLSIGAAAGLLANDTDADADTLSVVSVGAAANGSLTVAGDGSFTYVPNAGFAGNEFVTYVVSDGVGTATATLAIEVQNESPTAVNDSYSVHSGNTLTVAAGAGVLSNDSDGDGDPFSVLSHGAAANGTISIGADGAFEYTPNAGFAGNEFVTYVVSDGVGTATATLAIEVQNESPTAVNDSYSVHSGNTLTVAAGAGVLSNDSDGDGDPFSVLSHGAAANGTISIGADGAFEYTPNAGFAGNEFVTYVVSDGVGTATATLAIEVQNESPTAVNDSYSVHSGNTLTVAAGAGVLSNDSDGDGDPFSVLSHGAAANGTISIGADGAFEYTPNAGFAGNEFVTYVVSDGVGTATATLAIEVQNESPTAVNDSYSVHSGNTLTVAAGAGVLSNDSDGDGDPFSVLSHGAAANGTISIGADGAFEYTPNAGFAGNEFVTYVVSDGVGTATATLVIEVQNVAPVAGDDTYSVQTGNALVILAPAGVLANDGDPDGDVLSVVSHGDAANGAISIDADGALNYTPNPGFVGAETISYTISDGTSTASGQLTINVTPPGNTPPVAVADSYTVHAGETLTIAAAAGLLANDSDGDGDALSVLSFSAAANGTLNVVTDGSFTYAPNPGFTGTETITYTISDGTTTSSGTLTIEVQNAAPVAVDDSYTVQSGETLTVLAAAGLLANDTDADGDILRAISYSSPSNGVLDVVADGSFTYTSNAGFTGAETISYTISDGASTASGQLTINVTPPGNTPPVAVADSYTVHAGETLTIAAAAGLLANDSDGDGDALSVLSFSAAANGTLNVVTDGSFTYAPNPGFTGTETITYTISDGTTTSSGTLTIEVQNAAPAAVDDSYTVHAGETLTIAAAAGLLANDSDGDGDALSVLSFSAAANGTLNVVTDGSFTYAPNPGFTGTETITYTISDGTTTSSGTLTIEVQNAAPAAVDDSYTVHAGETLTIAAGAGLLANDSDGDGDALSVLSFSAAANGTLNVVTDGSFTYAPNPGFTGTETITYTISDGTTTSSGTLTIEVQNAAPVAVDDSYTVQSGETLTVLAAAGLLANDTDADGDILRAISYSSPSNGVLDVVADGSFTYTSNAGFTGAETISYTISDGTSTASGQLTINVTPPGNTPPVAVADSYTVHAGETLTIAAAAGLLANDSDGDGDALSVLSFSAAANGTLNVVTDGSFTYAPNPGFTGTETITYTISDGTTTSSGTLTIEVQNAAPVAVDDSYTVHAGETLTIAAAAGLLANDSDGDGDALSVLSFSAAANGTLNVVTDGSFTYAPNPGFTGTETITYTISDGTTTSSGTLTIEVQNAAPVAVDDSYTVTEGNTLLVDAGLGLLANDSDVDGDALAVVSFSTPVNGVLDIAGDGSFSYTPNPGFSGIETISYAIGDGSASSTAQLEITVEAAAEPEVVRIGDAPTRVSSANLNVIQDAWSGMHVASIEHKADITDAAEPWSDVSFSGVNTTTLAGVDHFSGDLGVSGQSLATSSIRQELDGREALRFELDQAANKVTVDLARFFLNDDGSVYAESGRLQVLDASGSVVGETVFSATATSGAMTVNLETEDAFSAVELTSGAYDGTDFIFGAYADAGGDFGTAPYADAAGKLHGSDFLVDWVEFEFMPLATPPAPDVGIG